MPQIRYIVTTHKYRRHDTCQQAIEERDRLRERFPDKDFRVLTVIDEPNVAAIARDETLTTVEETWAAFEEIDEAKDREAAMLSYYLCAGPHPDTGLYFGTSVSTARPSGIRASDGRPDDPFNGQCALDDLPKKYREA